MTFSVAVVGAGVIGLTSALQIQRRFKNRINVIIFTKDVSPNTTGDVAAGLWTPYLLGDTPMETIKKWSLETQDFIMKLWREGKAKEAGISLQSIVNITTDPDFQIPEWSEIALGFSQLSDRSLGEYSEKFGRKFAVGFTYVSFTWEASKFLPFLQQEFVTNGGEVVRKDIEQLEDLHGFDLIVNCTGLQARKLARDDQVGAIRGQIVRVEAPWQLHTFFADVGNDGGFYVIPNQNCVILGGTHQSGDYNLQVDENDQKFILEGCGRLLPHLKNATNLRHQVGLRPGRTQVRLELEERVTPGGEKLGIIHNYGHGGSGITLSIGCALSATELTWEVLAGTYQRHQSKL